MEFYRYEIREYASMDFDGDYVASHIPNPTVELRRYSKLRETPKGYWIGFGGGFRQLSWKKWVSKTSLRRYAYPSKEEAMQNFIKRTEKRSRILKRQALCCDIALGQAEVIRAKINN